MSTKPSRQRRTRSRTCSASQSRRRGRTGPSARPRASARSAASRTSSHPVGVPQVVSRIMFPAGTDGGRHRAIHRPRAEPSRVTVEDRRENARPVHLRQRQPLDVPVGRQERADLAIGEQCVVRNRRKRTSAKWNVTVRAVAGQHQLHVATVLQDPRAGFWTRRAACRTWPRWRRVAGRDCAPRGEPCAAELAAALNSIPVGVPLKQVQEWMGHHSPESTMAVYAKARPGDGAGPRCALPRSGRYEGPMVTQTVGLSPRRVSGGCPPPDVQSFRLSPPRDRGAARTAGYLAPRFRVSPPPGSTFNPKGRRFDHCTAIVRTSMATGFRSASSRWTALQAGCRQVGEGPFGLLPRTGRAAAGVEDHQPASLRRAASPR